MSNFYHDPQNSDEKGNYSKANKHKKFAKILLLHIGVLVLIILHIVLFKIM